MRLFYSIFFFCTLYFSPLLNAQDKTASTLAPCPNAPNCISSQETRKRKRMKPIAFTESADAALLKLEQLIASYSNATLVKKEGYYFHYAFKTNIGKFIDDVEFVIDAEQKVIHFRSASRKGYGDFGKNKRRMKRLKKKWYSLNVT